MSNFNVNVGGNAIYDGFAAVHGPNKVSLADKQGFSIYIDADIFEKLADAFKAQYSYIDYDNFGEIQSALGTFVIDNKTVDFLYFNYSRLYIFDMNVRNSVFKVLESLMQYTNEIQVVYPIKTPIGIVKRSTSIKSNDLKDKIYPWLFKFSVDQHGNEFDPIELGKNWNNQGNLIILHGPPGTGKSKSILWVGFGLRSKLNKNIYVNIITPDLLSDFNEIVSEAIVESDDDAVHLFVLDDFDKLGEKFIRGVSKEITDIISTLLQLTDGVIPVDNIKFIITSNRKIDEIDKALLRPGRLYRRIELSTKSFHDVFDDIIVPNDIIENFKKYFDIEFNYNRPLTLAEWAFLCDNIPELKTKLNRG